MGIIDLPHGTAPFSGDGSLRSLVVPLPGRILVVESEPGLARQLAESVRDLGHDLVGPAASASAAATLARTCRPDLALIAARLAGTDGLEVARLLRTLTGLPAVFMAGDGGQETLARLAAAFPLGIVHRPYSRYQLEAVLTSALRRLQARRKGSGGAACGAPGAPPPAHL